MDSIRKKFYIYILLFIMIICSISISIFIYSIKNVEKIYGENIQQSVNDIKKTFLKDTVNNVIFKIDQTHNQITNQYVVLANKSIRIFDEYNKLAPEKFLGLVINYFDQYKDKKAFEVIVLDKSANEIVYESLTGDLELRTSIEDKIKHLELESPYYYEKTYGKYTVLFAINKAYIEDLTKHQIAKTIHNEKFENDSYIWVNEVIDYNGGENYAIRRIHPNLKDTEGCYLSTEIKDIKGNKPYKTELDGVKEKGEIFFNYYFKRKNSEEISEKLTYAKLYKEYDWIIAMGVHVNDIQSYVNKTSDHSQSVIEKMVFYIVLIMVLLFISGYAWLTRLEKWYYKNSNKVLKEEINKDPLTKTFNRRAAQIMLNSIFRSYKRDGRNYAIIIYDVDNFKKINDTYGHDAGDLVLINIAKIINNNIRSTDSLYRWGGEEFLLICEGIKKEHVINFSQKLLYHIEEAEYGEGENKYHVTVSMGISYFESSDNDYNAAIKRADTALYNAKKSGKNSTCLYP
ncbi:MAG: sensor domain-containing diguanylate cyclase [Lutispora sp.]|nr:sensor domain-containing diguanylate cyclase [Lutispora sp.]MDD4833961.1 sensor domain-containing diguanylate cyclase [Lutispora sp.]